MLDISSNFLDEDDYDDTSSELNDQQLLIRVSTAPARPLNELEEFKRSQEFILLEQTVYSSSQLINKNYQKYDLDSIEGQKKCKKFLSLLEKLCDVFEVKQSTKEYREEFSKAYQILYKEGASYLTEILDSAQEAFPYLWVNGEKYVFSQEVLETGVKLLNCFYRMQNILRSVYQRIFQETENANLKELKDEIINSLEEFDQIWSNFEQLYVTELMIIENDARRFIAKAIEIEKDLESIEIRERLKGRIMLSNPDYHNLRKKLCKTISQLNSVANFEGKGRDDLYFEILLEAESIIRRVSQEQSKAVRSLADKIRNSFVKIRQLFSYYEQNIETVDPQLKNNQDLVDILQEYEVCWEKGKHYFLDHKKCNNLIHFSQILENTAEKYKQFAEAIEFRDADIFIQIPALIVLKNLNNEDKNIMKYFLPQVYDENENINKLYTTLKQDYKIWKEKVKSLGYGYYNMLEKHILSIELNTDQVQYQDEINALVHKMKLIAIEMERNHPQDWNSFLEAALDS